eukprot:1815628-Rhodomonas_salina.1
MSASELHVAFLRFSRKHKNDGRKLEQTWEGSKTSGLTGRSTDSVRRMPGKKRSMCFRFSSMRRSWRRLEARSSSLTALRFAGVVSAVGRTLLSRDSAPS